MFLVTKLTLSALPKCFTTTKKWQYTDFISGRDISKLQKRVRRLAIHILGIRCNRENS